MVYKSRYKKRSYSKKPSYYTHGMNALELASKSLVVAYGVKKLLNVEYKFHDVQLTTSAITPTGTIVQLTNIPQGDTDISRDGAQVKLTSTVSKFFIASNSSAFQTNIRVMLVLDKQTNGAIYTMLDLLKDTDGNDIIVSQLNLDNQYRFRVLYDKVISLSNVGITSAHRAIHKKLQHKLRFESSTPSIADLNSKSFSLVFISNQTTNSPLVTLFSRIKYLDN